MTHIATISSAFKRKPSSVWHVAETVFKSASIKRTSKNSSTVTIEQVAGTHTPLRRINSFSLRMFALKNKKNLFKDKKNNHCMALTPPANQIGDLVEVMSFLLLGNEPYNVDLW